MIEKEKIVLLTRLAVYDKHMSESDKKINNYFLHDYIYAKNIWTRFYAFIGSVIVVFFYLLYRILIEQTDVFAMDYRKEITDVAIFIIAVLVLYTLIGSLQAAVSYRASQKRIRAYLDVLNKTGEEKNARRIPGERTYERRYGQNIVYTGDNYQRGKKI